MGYSHLDVDTEQCKKLQKLAVPLAETPCCKKGQNDQTGEGLQTAYSILNNTSLQS